MFTTRLPTALTVAALLFSAAGLAACGSGDDDETTSSGANAPADQADARTIALLLPESKTTRYESQDRPGFTAELQRLCPDCELIYANADQDAAKQQAQAEAAITNGANVMVLDPVDAASAGTIVTRAQQSDIPVVSYDRLISDADIDYYVSFDNQEVGKLQGNALVRALEPPEGKTIVMINGAPTDSNAAQFKKGALSVLEPSGLDIAKQYDTPDWSPDKAQTEMEQAITAIGASKIDGVYAANDGTAGGAIAAMKGAGMDPSKVPTTGQDAELAAIQRIVAGDQYMTVYKAPKPETQAAAQLAFALSQGQPAPSGLINGEVDNGKKQVPSVLLKPVAVTKGNVKSTVVADGIYTVKQICTPQYADACEAAGLTESR